MRREAITDEELDATLRENGASSLEEVERIYLELDGQISVVKKK
ncbi:YetF domain-containing protein [Caballeronia glathei]|nr:YetF domain-containing protein [Caballeronia glathei]